MALQNLGQMKNILCVCQCVCVFSRYVSNEDHYISFDVASMFGCIWWGIKGDQADPRMRAASKKRGIEITSISRPIRPSDFWDFDLILAMDVRNRGRFCIWVRLIGNNAYHLNLVRRLILLVWRGYNRCIWEVEA